MMLAARETPFSIGDRRATRHIDLVAWQSKVGMVEDIEELRAEFDLSEFPQLEVLLQHKIEVHQIGAT
jgi:hypothetical protein